MKKQLRYYQKDAVNAIMAALKEPEAIPYIDSCTGSGKSLIAAHISNLGLKKNRRILQIVPSKELAEQNYAEAVGYVDNPHQIGVCCASLGRLEIAKRCVIATPNSFKPKMFRAGVFDLAIIDEAHLVSIDEGSVNRKIISYLLHKNPAMRIVGMTGSPYRLDQGMLHYKVPEGKQGSRLFTGCCYRSDIKRLIAEGYLSQIKNISGHLHADLSGLGGKEYNIQLMGVRFDAIAADAVADMKAKFKAFGITTSLVYTSTLENAKHILELWGDKSTMRIVYGDMPDHERKSAIQWIKHGHGERHIVNIGVLTTGFDFTALSCVVLLMATKSLSKYVQIVGRVLRVHEEKEFAYFLDYGTNAQRLGAIDDISVKPPSLGDGKAPNRTCGLCGNHDQVHAKFCTDCGEPYPKPEIGNYQMRSNAPVIQTEETETYQITSVSADLATSRSGVPMVKLLFYGLSGGEACRVHESYLCIEHEGFARQNAVKTMLSLLKPCHHDYFFTSMLEDSGEFTAEIVAAMFSEEYGHWFMEVEELTLAKNGKYKEIRKIKLKKDLQTN